jgi:hypothetical protein
MGLENHVMILGEERERTQGLSLARMDQIQRIFLSGYLKYPFITYMVQEYI